MLYLLYACDLMTSQVLCPVAINKYYQGAEECFYVHYVMLYNSKQCQQIHTIPTLITVKTQLHNKTAMTSIAVFTGFTTACSVLKMFNFAFRGFEQNLLCFASNWNSAFVPTFLGFVKCFHNYLLIFFLRSTRRLLNSQTIPRMIWKYYIPVINIIEIYWWY